MAGTYTYQRKISKHRERECPLRLKLPLRDKHKNRFPRPKAAVHAPQSKRSARFAAAGYASQPHRGDIFVVPREQ